MCINSQGFIFIRHLIFAINSNRIGYPIQRKFTKDFQQLNKLKLKRNQRTRARVSAGWDREENKLGIIERKEL